MTMKGMQYLLLGNSVFLLAPLSFGFYYFWRGVDKCNELSRQKEQGDWYDSSHLQYIIVAGFLGLGLALTTFTCLGLICNYFTIRQQTKQRQGCCGRCLSHSVLWGIVHFFMILLLVLLALLCDEYLEDMTIPAVVAWVAVGIQVIFFAFYIIFQVHQSKYKHVQTDSNEGL